MSIAAVSSAQTYASPFQDRPVNGSGSTDATDPLTALLRLASPPANQTNSPANSSPPVGGSNGTQFSPGSMTLLLSAQGQRADSGAGAVPGTNGSDDSSSDAQGASTTITTNPDGSITTTTAYADGTVKTATTPSSAHNGSSQSNGGQGDADQLLKMLAKGVQALAPAAALLAVL